MLRLLLRYLANNEALVKRLSESYPMQQAARFVVSILNRSKGIAEEQELGKKLNPEQIRRMLRSFTDNVKKEVEDLKRRKGM